MRRRAAPSLQMRQLRSKWLLSLMLLFLTVQLAPTAAPKLSSFRKKTKPPVGAHVVDDDRAGVSATAVPSVHVDAASKESGRPKAFTPAEEFEAKLADAKFRAKQGGKQGAQARADAKKHLESLVTEAEQLQRAGDLTTAGLAFDRALEVEPTSPRALANRAKVHYDLQELDHAEKLYRKALVAHPVDPSAWLNLALVQLRRRIHLSDARMHAERALMLLQGQPQDSLDEQMLAQAHSVLDAIQAAEVQAAMKDEL